MRSNTLIIIPAFNEAKVIASVINTVKKVVKNTDIVVIDDGSSDTTYEQAKKAGVTVLRHILNRGLGGAIGTGLAYAKKQHYDFAVTIDADGQHDPQDILPALEILTSEKADVVIGTRMHKKNQQMPLERKVINTLANWITYILFGVRTTDSQSGFRAFNAKAIEYLRIRTDRMEVSSEIFSEVHRLKLRLKEIPIKVIYTDYSLTKGQQSSNKWNVGYKLMLRLFR